MRKICLFIIALLLSFSCSKDGDGVGNDTFFSPPTWIQGEWEANGIDSNGNTHTEVFIFTQNNLIAQGINYNERINWVSEKYFTPTEQISTTNYKINLDGIGFTVIYNFSKISDYEINCVYERGENNDWSNRIIINYTLTRG